MNYFPFHIGDYASATRHLSWDEDIAYRRLLDIYYTTEKPLPTELRSVYRLVVASTDSQREAVKTVLEEFFTLSSDGWHNERADREVEQMQRKQAEIDEKNAHEKERMRRHRERRSEMFEALRKAGITPAWDIPMAELQRLHDKTCNAPETDLQREQAISCNGDETAIPIPTPTPIPIDIPPIPPKGGKVAKDSPISFDVWLKTVKDKGEKPIPEDDPVHTYAAEVGIPYDFLALCWNEFKDRYRQPGAKRYKDWRAVFRKAVRGNWFKLWWIEADGSYALTTVGKQAERKAA